MDAECPPRDVEANLASFLQGDMGRFHSITSRAARCSGAPGFAGVTAHRSWAHRQLKTTLRSHLSPGEDKGALQGCPLAARPAMDETYVPGCHTVGIFPSRSYINVVLICFLGKDEYLLYFFFFLTTVHSCPLAYLSVGLLVFSQFLGTLHICVGEIELQTLFPRLSLIFWLCLEC